MKIYGYQDTDIEKQMNAGFTRDEVYSNLLAKGYNQQEIDATMLWYQMILKLDTVRGR